MTPPVHPLGILAAALDRGVAALDPADVGPDLRLALELAAGLDGYVEANVTPASPALAALEASTAETDWSGRGALEAEMLSGPVEARLLAFLVGATRARRVLEIGLFTGYSALAMAEALPADGELVACEIDADVAARARESFAASPAGDRIEVKVGPAQETLVELSGSFDLVFIDADKAGYAGYLETVLARDLLAPNGLVAVDNTLMQGQPWGAGERTENGEAIAAFNAAVAGDPRVEQVLIPVRDGLTLIRRVDDG